VSEWPVVPSSREITGGHIRPLTAEETLEEIQKVNCRSCWSYPQEPCRPFQNEYKANDPRVMLTMTPEGPGWYHASRKVWAELKVGL
jgi:hypothetical protein